MNRKTPDALALFKRDFQKEMKSVIRKDHPYITSHDLATRVFEQNWLASWKGLTRAEKKEYYDKAEKVKQAHSERGARFDQQLSFVNAEVPPADVKSPLVDVKSPLVDHGRLYVDNLECVICMDAPKSALIRPCNHVAACMSCSEKLKLCPACNTAIQEIELIFII